MHAEILTEQQKELVPFINRFKRSLYLVGRTAIALQLGHRQSVDFDLFTPKKLNKTKIKQLYAETPFPKTIVFEDTDQIHFTINGVKVTFFQYPFPVEPTIAWEKNISLPDLLSLAAMKAYALGRRSKWKDYVDLYFLLKHFSVKDISQKAEQLFGADLFSVKLFVQQLAFHKDIDYSETVDYLLPHPPTSEEVKNKLIEEATDIF